MPWRLALVMLVGVLSLPLPAAQISQAQGTTGQPSVSGPVRVSGPGPFVQECEGPEPNARVYRNSVVEPSLAVDPSDPLHLVGAWQQDRWATAGADGQVAAVSWDGGATWTTSLAAFSRCQGGTAALATDYDRISDPWVTISPKGDVYQMTIAYDDPQNPASQNAMLVSKSIDGGASWGAPVALIRDDTSQFFNDKNSITADPTLPGYVYAVWQREDVLAENETAPDIEQATFARTVDGGLTWEAPRTIIQSPEAAATGNVIVVLPSGDLVDVFTLTTQQGVKTVSDLKAIQSSDKGLTWSDPVQIARMDTVDLVDPISTFTIRPTPDNIAGIAVDQHSGQVYAAWTSGQFSGGKHSDIAIASSVDGGRTWSSALKVNQTPSGALAFVPTVAVLDDGTVGVSYYDLRNNTPSQPGILANHWLTYCNSDCSDSAGWHEVNVAGPFNLQRAPYARGFFVGDYMGIVGTNAFDLLYVTTTPPGDPEVTAAYFAAVTP